MNRFSWISVFLSFFAAAVLEVLVLPDNLLPFRPEWVTVTLIYWLIRQPERIGIISGVVVGLVIDVITSTPFGVYSLAYAIISFLILSMHQRIKMFPVFQQAFIIFFLSSIQLMIVQILSAILLGGETGLHFLYGALMSAIIWPLVLVLTDRLVLSLR